MHGACKTCRVDVRFGYGSYSTWMTTYRTVKEFDADLNEQHKELFKNKNYRIFLEKHEDHDFVVWSPDWGYEDKNHLMIEMGWSAPEILVESFGEYQRIDLDP